MLFTFTRWHSVVLANRLPALPCIAMDFWRHSLSCYNLRQLTLESGMYFAETRRSWPENIFSGVCGAGEYWSYPGGCSVRFQRLNSAHNSSPTMTRAPTVTPTPIPAFAPVGRPLWSQVPPECVCDLKVELVLAWLPVTAVAFAPWRPSLVIVDAAALLRMGAEGGMKLGRSLDFQPIYADN